MTKPIRILISVIMLMFGFVFADCLYGLTIGGEMNIVSSIIFLVVGLVLSFASTLFIFWKEETKNTRDVFIIILIVFMVACIFAYKPLNRISGNNEYTEKQVEVVEVNAIKGSFPLLDPEYYITVKDKNGDIYEVEEYHAAIYYDEGDNIIVREYMGGFNLKYCMMVVN